MRALVPFLATAILGGIPVAAQPAGPDQPTTQQMEFTFEAPQKPIALFGNTWRIFATGPIDRGAAARLKQALVGKTIPDKSILYLDSPGGNVLEGIELGRVIREAGLLTYVGRHNPDNYVSLPGACFSACSLAFLGGRFRYIEKGSVYGVHRFSFGGDVGNTTDVSQVLSAAIVQFVRDMGVDAKLFALMTEAGKDDIRILTLDEMKTLLVVNDGTGRPMWSIESIKASLYLKGERDTVWGMDKVLLTCEGGQIILGGIFGDRGHADTIVNMHAASILIDDNTVRIPAERTEGPSARNGTAAVFFRLSQSEIRQVMRAKAVGVAVQFAYEAPVFSGIYPIDISEGREKMLGVLSACHAFAGRGTPRSPAQKP